MPLARMLYRRNKVWVDVDESGQPVATNGLAKIRYRQDSSETYSAKLAEIAPLPPAAAPGATPPEEKAAPRKRTPRPRAPKDPAAAGATKRPARPRKTAVAESASPEEIVLIHSDGSCFGNPGPAGIGVTLEWKGHLKEVSQFLGDGTNNIAELTAIKVALELVKNRRLPVRVHTDSAYAIGVLSEGWKVKQNKELVASIQELMRDFPDLRLVKVRGHSGDPRNERVDQLARDAITRRA